MRPGGAASEKGVGSPEWLQETPLRTSTETAESAESSERLRPGDAARAALADEFSLVCPDRGYRWVAVHCIRALRRAAAITLAAGVVLLAVGCHHQTQQAYQPAPPPLGSSGHRGTATAKSSERPAREPGTDDLRGKPILVETGLASWYGPNYNHHGAADGSVYNQNGMTAAHNTLPLGTTVRVTNLANGEQVTVRITDRGPFVHGRILDLSVGAAKKIDLYRMGVARVRIEAYPHVTADPAGRWCVQTGAFKSQGDAVDLKNALIKRYRGARVIEFAGPTGYWVRIDPVEHDKADAEAMLNWIGDPDPQARPYLVRVD